MQMICILAYSIGKYTDLNPSHKEFVILMAPLHIGL